MAKHPHAGNFVREGNYTMNAHRRQVPTFDDDENNNPYD